jgi:hypothetical protein
MVTVKRKLNVSIASRGRIAIRPHDLNAETPRPRPSSKLPRISKLMALAIRFDEMLRTGEASDTIELARRGHVTQPRMSQIMALNQLAPDIQEALLNLPATKGKPEIHEKRLRPIAAMLRWEDQRGAWRQICDEVGLGMDALAESADRF